VLGEDDTLLREILFNPLTSGQVGRIRTELSELIDIIDNKDEERLGNYLTKIRKNIE
jgi:prephenate dehydrogenase